MAKWSCLVGVVAVLWASPAAAQPIDSDDEGLPPQVMVAWFPLLVGVPATAFFAIADVVAAATDGLSRTMAWLQIGLAGAADVMGGTLVIWGALAADNDTEAMLAVGGLLVAAGSWFIAHGIHSILEVDAEADAAAPVGPRAF